MDKFREVLYIFLKRYFRKFLNEERSDAGPDGKK